MMGPYERVDQFYENAVALGSDDIAFAIARFRNLNRSDPAAIFTGRLDFSRTGLFGHSLGGRICGEVAARDDSIRAIATMEGTLPREARQEGQVRGAILFMYSSQLPEELALPNMEDALPRRSGDVLFARFEGLGHNSSTDLPLITDSYQYAVAPLEGMRLMRLTLTRFFDAYVRGEGAFPGDALTNEERIVFRRNRGR